jgi:hypothetical protein
MIAAATKKMMRTDAPQETASSIVMTAERPPSARGRAREFASSNRPESGTLTKRSGAESWQ